MTTHIVGIDISQDHLDVHLLRTGQGFRVEQKPKALARLAAHLAALDGGVACIVMEATGGLERCAARALMTAGLPVAIVNPCQARRYAQARGVRAKTDRLDARVLAQMGEDLRPQIRPIADERQQALADLVMRRTQIVDQIGAETCRQGRSHEPSVRQSLARSLRFWRGEKTRVEKLIDAMIEADAVWKEASQRLRAVPGVGPGNIRVALALLPELGTLTRRQIASLAGVAPIACDSGKHQGRRSIAGGRGAVRRVLYMAALVGMRSNPCLRVFAQRLAAQGKPPKVVITACMRKLLVILNAMIRDKSQSRITDAQA